MILIPAIDLRKGRAVRLYKGDYNKEKAYNKSPLQIAKEFAACGVQRIHIVDLDGAKGDGTNRRTILAIAKKVSIPLDTGGGIRTLKDIQELLEGGIKRVVLGTMAIEQPELVLQALKMYPGRVTVGVDALDGFVKVRGWLSDSKKNAFDLICEMISIGVDEIIYTDISKDGTLEGPNFSIYAKLAGLPVNIIASGGVSSLADLKKLKTLPLTGVIVGKALYEEKFTLEDALEVLA